MSIENNKIKIKIKNSIIYDLNNSLMSFIIDKKKNSYNNIK